ncbi:uncharacterized protein LOC112506194 [Cynara cardunculus var. scolymus]|uniref:uncharacterized protein LOC112506194 n=1 Tax=Cynara cardunculus var. scolymus TaxID=59895 RepID=UPI000D627E76|nr:uncharacterized protein LOC112506194 [Cynara cardunculus var. scolymus]
MTRVLQNTLPSMLKAILGDRFKGPEEEEEASTQKEKTMNNSQPTEKMESSVQGKDEPPVQLRVESQTKERGCSYKTFSSTRSKEFRGIEGPVALMNWVTKIQSCFKICKCSEEQKVTYAATTFGDSALHWWETECAIRGDENIATLTWEEIKKMLMDKYCTQTEVKKLESEFLRLEQGSLSVQEYVNKFLEKARFASYQVATEQRKIDRFKDSLRIEIKQYVDMVKPTTFVQAVEMATVTEENNIKATRERREVKRKWEASSKLTKKSKGEMTDTKARNGEFTIPQ